MQVSTQSPSSQVSSVALYASQGSYKDFLVSGIIPMVVVFGALFGGGISLISDRQLGNLKAFLITPINKDAIVLSRVLSGAVQGMLYAFLALGVGLINGANVAMGFSAIIYIALLAVILSAGFTAIAIMIASKIKKVEVYAIVTQAIGLPLWFISGGLLPTQALPSFLQPLAALDPLTYANTLSRGVVLVGNLTFNQIALNLGILLAFAVVCVFMCYKVFDSSNGE